MFCLQRKIYAEIVTRYLDKKAEPIPYDRQVTLIKGIKEMASLKEPDFDIIIESNKIYVIRGCRKIEIYVYPTMWIIISNLPIFVAKSNL